MLDSEELGQQARDTEAIKTRTGSPAASPASSWQWRPESSFWKVKTMKGGIKINREKTEKDQRRRVSVHQVCNVSALRADVLSARFFKVYFKSFEASWEEKKNSLILSFKVSGFCCTGRHLHEGELPLSKGSFSELGCARAHMSTCVGDIWELFPQQSIIHQVWEQSPEHSWDACPPNPMKTRGLNCFWSSHLRVNLKTGNQCNPNKGV